MIKALEHKLWIVLMIFSSLQIYAPSWWLSQCSACSLLQSSSHLWCVSHNNKLLLLVECSIQSGLNSCLTTDFHTCSEGYEYNARLSTPQFVNMNHTQKSLIYVSDSEMCWHCTSESNIPCHTLDREVYQHYKLDWKIHLRDMFDGEIHRRHKSDGEICQHDSTHSALVDYPANSVIHQDCTQLLVTPRIQSFLLVNKSSKTKWQFQGNIPCTRITSGIGPCLFCISCIMSPCWWEGVGMRLEWPLLRD